MDWEKCLISIATFTPFRRRPRGAVLIDAEVCGIWAIHKCIDRFMVEGEFFDFDCYALTHWPTGCAAVHVHSSAAAKEFAQNIKHLSWHLVKNRFGNAPQGFEVKAYKELRDIYEIKF